MHPGGEITLRVIRGRGRMEPRNNLPRQLEFKLVKQMKARIEL